MTATCPGETLGASSFSTYASKPALVVATSTARDGPMPESVMLQSSVTLLPQLRGAEHSAAGRKRRPQREGTREEV